MPLGACVQGKARRVQVERFDQFAAYICLEANTGRARMIFCPKVVFLLFFQLNNLLGAVIDPWNRGAIFSPAILFSQANSWE